MTNNEIIRIEKKNPNKPNEPPTVLGIFPSAVNQLDLTASLVKAIIFDQLNDVEELDTRMEQDLIDEFEKLRSNSTMVAACGIQTSNNKRGMIVYLIEK